jgi:hypothetical protein
MLLVFNAFRVKIVDVRTDTLHETWGHHLAFHDACPSSPYCSF